MPFEARNLTGGSHVGSGGRSFRYRTSDTLATVSAANYFNSARAKLSVGDDIIITAGDGTDDDGTSCAHRRVSAISTSGAVTIAALTA